jgi:uncharacterized MAPEG superfamily protein
MADIDPAALTPLILFALWAVLLVLLLGVARGHVGRREQRAPSSFKPYGDNEQLDAFSRAHANTVENLPVFIVVYLAALWLGADAPVVTLGWVILGARLVQSVIHILSRSGPAVGVRAAMQVVQMVCFVWLGVAALQAIY